MSSLIRQPKFVWQARPYRCTECGLDFVLPEELGRHLLRHTGSRTWDFNGEVKVTVVQPQPRGPSPSGPCWSTLEDRVEEDPAKDPGYESASSNELSPTKRRSASPRRGPPTPRVRFDAVVVEASPTPTRFPPPREFQPRGILRAPSRAARARGERPLGSASTPFRRYLCPTCGRDMHYPVWLALHVKTHKPREERRVEAVVADVEALSLADPKTSPTTTRPNLLRGSNEGARFECKLCGRDLKYKSWFLLHKRHCRPGRPRPPPPGPKPFGIKTRRGHRLFFGRRTFAEEKQHQCTACGTLFGRKNGLEGHLNGLGMQCTALKRGLGSRSDVMVMDQDHSGSGENVHV